MTEPESAGIPSISAVVPMYNEEENAEKAILTLKNVLQDGFRDYEILVVESGSTDRTAAIADRMAGSDTRIRVIHQINREGLGSAIRLGLANATKDYILYLDGDEPFDIGEINRIIPLLGEWEAIIGYRIGRRVSFRRRLLSGVYNRLVQILLGLDVRDVNFSMKVISRELLGKLRLRADSCFYDAELIAEIRRSGTGIRELGFEYTPRKTGESTLDRPSIIVRMLMELSSYFVKRRIFGR
jgi:glycosyltransferase involved in cell wall biosynthesis